MFRKQYSTCFFRFNVKSDDGVRASSMLSLVLPFFKYISRMVSSNPVCRTVVSESLYTNSGDAEEGANMHCASSRA